MGSTVHCIAGDATGIILAAVCVALIGLPMWLDLIIEYIAGFSFGLFIFQSLFMCKVMGGSYLENVCKTFLPEFISMNSMMSGMAPVMALLMTGRDMRAMWPGEPLFWFVMSLGIYAGFTVAYPVNVWLVSRGMKHGLMTIRGDSSHRNKSWHGAQPDRQLENHAQGSISSDAHGSDKKPTLAQLTAVTGFTVLMLIQGCRYLRPSSICNWPRIRSAS